MDDTVLIEGKTHISSRRAAKLSGYTQDYVGQLVRGKRVTAKKIGRSWYIQEISFRDYISGNPVLIKKEFSNDRERLINREKVEKEKVSGYHPEKIRHGILHRFQKLTAFTLSLLIVSSAIAFANTVSPQEVAGYVSSTTDKGLAMVSSAEALLRQSADLANLYGKENTALVAASGENPLFIGAQTVALGVYETFHPAIQNAEYTLAALFAPRVSNIAVSNVSESPITINLASSTTPMTSSSSALAVYTPPVTTANPVISSPNNVYYQTLGETQDEVQSQIAAAIEPLIFQINALGYRGGTTQSNVQNVYDNIDFSRINGANIDKSFVSDSAFTGGTISGASITNSSIDVLNVGNGLSNIAGDLTVSGTTTVNNLFAANSLTSNSTTTSATSTNLYAANVVLANATTTNLFTDSLNALSETIDSITSNVATIFGLTATNATTTSATTTNEFDANLVASNATTTGNAYVGGNLTVGGNSVTLGNSSANTLVVNSAVGSNLIPNQNATYDIGSPAYYWNNEYVATLNVNNLSAASSTIGGTTDSNFTINSGNGTPDTESMSLTFFRGTVVPNAVIAWNSTTKRFELNQSAFIQNGSTNLLSSPTLSLEGQAGQTGDIFDIASSTGQNYFNISATGTTNTLGLTFTSATGTSATTTNFYASLLNSITGTITNFTSNLATIFGLTATNATTTNATTTNLVVFNSPVAPAFIATSTTAVSSLQQLLVNASTTLQNFTFQNATGTNATTSTLYVSGQSILAATGGDVGIGLTNPSYPLDIYNAASGALRLNDSNNAAIISTVKELAATNLNFTVSGTNAMTIRYNGNIGIGTTTPWAFFSINPNANSQGPLFVVGSSTATQFIISNTGLVGIGTTSPLSKFDIVSNYNDTTDTFRIDAPDPGDYHLTINPYVVGNGNVGYKFKTTDTAVTVTAMAITGTGNIGIGTTTPDATLSLNGSGGSYIDFGNSGPVKAYIGTSGIFGAASTDDLRVRSDGPNIDFGFSGQITDVINSSGSMGIGTTTPNAKLDVLGTTGSPATSGYTQNGIFQIGASIGGNGLDFGVLAGAPYSTWMQSGYLGNYSLAAYYPISLNPLGGNVGIGTTNPTAKLEIAGTGSTLVQASTTDVTTSSASGFQSLSDASILTMQNHGSARVVSRYGLTLGGWTEITAQNNFGTNNGIVIGTQSAVPIVFGTNNTEYMRITGAGNVGIGTPGPGYKLDVQGNAGIVTVNTNGSVSAGGQYVSGIGSFASASDGTDVVLQAGATTLMTLKSGGNVGIGTASPQVRTHIVGPSLTESSETSYALWVANTNAPTKALIMGYDTTADIAVINAVQQGVTWKNIAMQTNGGNVGIGTTNPGATLDVNGYGRFVSPNGGSTGAVIIRDASGNPNAAYLQFTNNADSVEYADIRGLAAGGMALNGGNVGIGTTNPSQRLSVNQSLAITNVGGGGAQYLLMGNQDSAGVNNPVVLQAANGDLSIGHGSSWTDPVGGTFSSNVTFKNGGNVGIGTTNPAYKLDVNGTANIGGNFTVGGNLTINGSYNTSLYSLTTSRSGGVNYAYPDVAGASVGLVLGGTSNGNGTIALNTTGSNTTPTMYLSTTGNVGIGTTAPESNLTVQNTNAGGRGGEISITNLSNTINSEAALNFGVDNSSYNADSGNGQIKVVNMDGATMKSDMVFSTWNGSAFGERMRIQSGGNVGIGRQSRSINWILQGLLRLAVIMQVLTRLQLTVQ